MSWPHLQSSPKSTSCFGRPPPLLLQLLVPIPLIRVRPPSTFHPHRAIPLSKSTATRSTSRTTKSILSWLTQVPYHHDRPWLFAAPSGLSATRKLLRYHAASAATSRPLMRYHAASAATSRPLLRKHPWRPLDAYATDFEASASIRHLTTEGQLRARTEGIHGDLFQM